MLNLWDVVIAVCNVGLIGTTMSTLFNKRAQVPRWTSSVPIAAFLTVMVPAFYQSGLMLTVYTLGGQAIVWWLIAKFRAIRKQP